MSVTVDTPNDTTVIALVRQLKSGVLYITGTTGFTRSYVCRVFDPKDPRKSAAVMVVARRIYRLFHSGKWAQELKRFETEKQRRREQLTEEAHA